MASIPSPIRKWVREFITGEGSEEIASQSPVQSVNTQTGDVTISVPVDQVNGQTGDVTLTASDVNALADTYSAPVQSVNGSTGNVTISVPVDQVNGQTGDVTLTASDVNALADTYSAPVQSVNSQTGDVTISTGGGAIPSSQTVTSYSDLPLTDLSEAEIWFVTGENDIVASTQLSPVEWRSLSDFTLVAVDVPDSVVEQLDARGLTGFSDGDTVSTYSATVGTDLSQGSGTFQAGGAYNNDSVEYDGTDGHQADISRLSQPYTIYAVVDADAVADGNTRVVCGSQGDGNRNTPDADLAFTGSEWLWYAGSSILGSTNKDRQIVTVHADGANSYIREDASQTGSGDGGSNDIYLLSVGYYGRVGGRRWLGDVPFVEIHDGTPSNGVTGREQDIINDWGLSV